MSTVVEKPGNNMGGETASPTNPKKGRPGKRKTKMQIVRMMR